VTPYPSIPLLVSGSVRSVGRGLGPVVFAPISGEIRRRLKGNWVAVLGFLAGVMGVGAAGAPPGATGIETAARRGQAGRRRSTPFIEHRSEGEPRNVLSPRMGGMFLMTAGGTLIAYKTVHAISASPGQPGGPAGRLPHCDEDPASSAVCPPRPRNGRGTVACRAVARRPGAGKVEAPAVGDGDPQ